MATIITTQEFWSKAGNAAKIETRDGIVCVLPHARPPGARTFDSIEDARAWLDGHGFTPAISLDEWAKTIEGDAHRDIYAEYVRAMYGGDPLN